VLNEVVICRGQYVRPIQISASVDGSPLATYIADGLIASTATGSTAYAMAAGGPIMPPELRSILIMPVAPHLSMDRGILLPEGAFINMTVHTDHEAVLSLDGSLPIAMLPEDVVKTAAGEHTVSFIRFQDPGYFYRNLTRYMERNPVAGKIV
jgi:NAD+ kinase